MSYCDILMLQHSDTNPDTAAFWKLRHSDTATVLKLHPWQINGLARSPRAQADSYAVRLFCDSILAFQPMEDVLRPQSDGVGHVLLGMSSPTLREVLNAKTRLYTGAVRIVADQPTSRLAKIWSTKSDNRLIFERGTASYYFSSDYAPWAKTRTTPLGKRIFELGTCRRDSGLVPRNVLLISSVYRSKTNMNEKMPKSKGIKSDSHRKWPQRSRNVWFLNCCCTRTCSTFRPSRYDDTATATIKMVAPLPPRRLVDCLPKNRKLCLASAHFTWYGTLFRRENVKKKKVTST